MGATSMPLLHTVVALVSLAAAAQNGFDHEPFDRLLRSQVRNGWVDYDAFAEDPAFPAYLASFARYDPALLPAPDRLAFWINAYNAFTIALINQHRERHSIRDIGGGPPGVSGSS